MIWVNTDYASALIKAAAGMLEHYGEADAPGLTEALAEAQTARDEWGDILFRNPDEAAGSPNNDVQDLLHFIAGTHDRFDRAIRNLESTMRNLSTIGSP